MNDVMSLEPLMTHSHLTQTFGQDKLKSPYCAIEWGGRGLRTGFRRQHVEQDEDIRWRIPSPFLLWRGQKGIVTSHRSTAIVDSDVEGRCFSSRSNGTAYSADTLPSIALSTYFTWSLGLRGFEEMFKFSSIPAASPPPTRIVPSFSRIQQKNNH